MACDDSEKPGRLLSLQAGYHVLATTWSISAMMHLVAFSLLAQTSLATKNLFALSHSHYFLVMLSLKHLSNAAEHQMLETENNRALNVAFAFSIACTTAITASPAVSSSLLRLAAPTTALIAGTFSVVFFLRAWSISRNQQKNALLELLIGVGKSHAAVLRPKNAVGAVYRLIALGFFAQSMLCVCFPSNILGWAGVSQAIATAEGAELALVQWGTAQIFHTSVAFALARAADESTSSTAYTDIKAGFVLTLLLQALL
eukprot:3572847-Rhodomonas_salina.1